MNEKPLQEVIGAFAYFVSVPATLEQLRRHTVKERREIQLQKNLKFN